LGISYCSPEINKLIKLNKFYFRKLNIQNFLILKKKQLDVVIVHTKR